MNEGGLQEIVRRKRIKVDGLKARFPLDSLKERIAGISQVGRDFAGAISESGEIALVAELKKASPSAGVLREDFNPVAIAGEYERAGANAISVLTEEDFFQGATDVLSKVREITSKPILAKDFFVDEYQIYEAKLCGADCILLIAGLLEKDMLVRFMKTAEELELASLVEVHDEGELEKAVSSGAEVIGINNRNLENFEVDLKTTERLRKLLPGDRVVVSESGIKTRDDVEYLSSVGVDAILVGEVLMRAENIPAKISELLGKDG